jgi:hypothetical protein
MDRDPWSLDSRRRLTLRVAIGLAGGNCWIGACGSPVTTHPRYRVGAYQHELWSGPDRPGHPLGSDSESWSRSNTEAITWSNGVAIGKVIGIDFSGQTSFNTNASQQINFTEGGHLLCGRFSAPGVTHGC